MKRTKTLCVVAALLLLLSLVAIAQEKPDKPPADKAPAKQVGGLRFLDVSEVTIVNVDVTVSDKKGPVLSLKPEDFEIYQDGKPQPVTNFAIYKSTVLAQPTPAPAVAPAPTAPVATPTPALAPPPSREPRFLVFYVDNENLQPLNRNRVLNRVIEWVVGHLEPPDQAMVVSYQRSLKVLQRFTSNSDEVAAALRLVKKYTGGGTDIAASRTRVEDYIQENSSNQSTFSSALDQAKSFAREQHNNLTFAVRSLQDVVGTMSGLPGKKAIIYISDGLAMTPGLELYYAIQDAYTGSSVISESRDNDAVDLFQGLVHSAASAGVTLYTLDARGLQSDSGISAENKQARSPLAAAMMTSNYQDSLIYMADHTGGLAILNANDPTPGLNKIAADFETYYSLGYRLIPTGEDRAHRIQVKVKGHPEYRLNYRTMFIEKALPTRIGDRVMSGLSYDLEDNPLGIELKAGIPAPADNGRWTLPVEVSFPLNKVALIPGMVTEDVEKFDSLTPGHPYPLALTRDPRGGIARVYLPGSAQTTGHTVRLVDTVTGRVLMEATTGLALTDLEVPLDLWPADTNHELHLFRGFYEQRVKPDMLVGYVMVYYAARDDEGKQSELQRTEHEISIPASEYERARHQLFTVKTDLLLESGRYRISVGVRDELTNQAGYALAKASVHPESS